MHIPGIAGRSARKAPLIEFFTMSVLQGRKVGFSLYEAPTPAQVRVRALIEQSHAYAAECLLVVEEGAPELPDVALNTQQLAKICSGCINAMLAQSKTGKLAHQEREWLMKIFGEHLPQVSTDELQKLSVAATKPPAGQVASDELSGRYAYEISKALPALAKLAGSQGLAVLIAHQEATCEALHRAKHTHSLRSYPKVKVHAPAK